MELTRESPQVPIKGCRVTFFPACPLHCTQSDTCWESPARPKSGRLPQRTNSETPFELHLPNYEFPWAKAPPPFSTLANPNE